MSVSLMNNIFWFRDPSNKSGNDVSNNISKMKTYFNIIIIIITIIIIIIIIIMCQHTSYTKYYVNIWY